MFRLNEVFGTLCFSGSSFAHLLIETDIGSKIQSAVEIGKYYATRRCFTWKKNIWGKVLFLTQAWVLLKWKFDQVHI